MSMASCMRGWFSIQCEHNVFQYPRLTVPISRERELGLTSGLKWYTKRIELGVPRQTERQCIRVRNPEKSVPQVNDALASRHSDGPPTEHRMTVTMAPGASSGCTKAYPIASDAPTTSPSHGDTSSVHGESPRVIPEKRYVLVHPRVHQP